MTKNPYHYKGPLDPEAHKDVLIPRNDHLKIVLNGIENGDYWIILGPREIGRTTFLRQIARELKNHYHIFLNMQVPHKSEENFYQWMMEQFIEQIPSSGIEIKKNKKTDSNPSHRFLNFLKNIKIKEDKRIILLFDEIEGIPSLKNFFQVWKAIHQDRFHKEELNRYSVIIAGTADLLELKTPLNIAGLLYMRDFSGDECEQLIDRHLNGKGCEIDPGAKKRLMEQISGHPKMLQQACSILFNTAITEKRKIVETDINKVIDRLLKENSAIDMLIEDVKKNPDLEKLIEKILQGDKCSYRRSYKKYAITGAGPIIENQNKYCVIRNKVYEQFLCDLLYIDVTDLSDTEIVSSADEELKNFSPSSKYKFIEIIGKGGMGQVVKADDLMLHRPVAIKKLKKKLFKEKCTLEQFKKEARLPAGLSHPNIVTVYELIIEKNDCQIVMEFIDGPSLREIIKKGEVFNPSQIIYIAKKISEALVYLHQHKIIHRDIKPKNIMLTPEGKIKLVDFGVAVIKEDKASGDTGIIMGTPQYMAPEQFFGEKAHYLTDIYSMGITLFHLAAGKVPFDAENFEDLRGMHLNEPLPSLKEFRNDIDDDLEQIIKKCAAKDQKERFQSAGELLDTLNLKWKSINETAIENELKKKIRRINHNE